MDQAHASAPLWQIEGIACVLVAAPVGYDVELRNAAGVPFLRKAAPTPDEARNEAEYLRLVLEAGAIASHPGELKPFALVVEDDPDSCEAFTEALKGVGIRALGVSCGREAVRLAKALTPDLVVIDYRLPDITGSEVCRQLRADPETESLPVIAVTGAPETMRADGCLADAILAKPCRLETFLAAARLFLRPALPA